MEWFVEELSSSLMAVYRNIKRLEEQTIKSSGRIDLTINEIHMIDYIGRAGESGRTVREIAGKMNIKSPSATVAVNKLVKNGYLEKRQSELDARAVHVMLTRAGKLIFAYHRYYLRLMVKELTDGFNDDEVAIMVRIFDNLNNFIDSSITP